MDTGFAYPDPVDDSDADIDAHRNTDRDPDGNPYRVAYNDAYAYGLYVWPASAADGMHLRHTDVGTSKW